MYLRRRILSRMRPHRLFLPEFVIPKSLSSRFFLRTYHAISFFWPLGLSIVLGIFIGLRRLFFFGGISCFTLLLRGLTNVSNSLSWVSRYFNLSELFSFLICAAICFFNPLGYKYTPLQSSKGHLQNIIDTDDHTDQWNSFISSQFDNIEIERRHRLQ